MHKPKAPNGDANMNNLNRDAAATLIMAAAKKSGLLKVVTEGLAFISKYPGRRRELHAIVCDDLAEKFDRAMRDEKSDAHVSPTSALEDYQDIGEQADHTPSAADCTALAEHLDKAWDDQDYSDCA
jgi:hypothetical protein